MLAVEHTSFVFGGKDTIDGLAPCSEKDVAAVPRSSDWSSRSTHRSTSRRPPLSRLLNVGSCLKLNCADKPGGPEPVLKYMMNNRDVSDLSASSFHEIQTFVFGDGCIYEPLHLLPLPAGRAWDDSSRSASRMSSRLVTIDEVFAEAVELKQGNLSLLLRTRRHTRGRFANTSGPAFTIHWHRRVPHYGHKRRSSCRK